MPQRAAGVTVEAPDGHPGVVTEPEEPELPIVETVAPVLEQCATLAEALARLLLTLLPS